MSIKQIIIYLGALVASVVCVYLIITTYRTEIIEAAKWLGIMALVFGAGWVVGRYGRRDNTKKLPPHDDE